jgi:hypothetical protein
VSLEIIGIISQNKVSLGYTTRLAMCWWPKAGFRRRWRHASKAWRSSNASPSKIKPTPAAGTGPKIAYWPASRYSADDLERSQPMVNRNMSESEWSDYNFGIKARHYEKVFENLPAVR